MGISADEVLQKDDNSRPQCGANKRSRSPEDNHEECLEGGSKLGIHGAHKTIVVSPEDSRYPAEGASHDIGQVYVKPGVISQDSHARLAFPDSHKALAER